MLTFLASFAPLPTSYDSLGVTDDPSVLVDVMELRLPYVDLGTTEESTTLVVAHENPLRGRTAREAGP